MQLDNSSRRGDVPTIGLLIDSVVGLYQAGLWSGVADLAQERGVNLICFAGGSLKGPRGFGAQRNALYDLVSETCVDGLIVSGIVGAFVPVDEFQAFCDRYRPLPLVGMPLRLEGFPSVDVDNAVGMRDLLDHLIEVHGYRRFAFISGVRDQPNTQTRYRVFAQVLAEYGLALDPALVAPGDYTPSSGTEAVRLLLDHRKVDFEVVVAANDNMAIAAMEELQRRGLNVPDDVAVVGFDDIEEARVVMPSLTTVRQPLWEQGRRAAELLLALLGGEEVPEREEMLSALVVRRSCGCLPPSAQRAAVGEVVRAPAGETFETAFAARQGHILCEVRRAAKTSRARARGFGTPEWAERFVGAFAADVQAQSPGVFLPTLEGMSRDVVLQGEDVALLQEALSALRRHTMPCFTDEEMLSRAENLWQQARVLIGQTAQQAQAQRRLSAERQFQASREIDDTLITTMDVTQLMDVLAQELPRLGIEGCYLSLYEGQDALAEWSRLVLAYSGEGRVELETGGRRFPSHRLVPEGVLPPGRRRALLAEALYFRGDQLGFILFETGLQGRVICEALRGQISSALQGALLVQRVIERTAELAAVNKELETFAYSVSHDLRAPLRSILGYSRALQEDCADKLDEEGRDHLLRVQAAARRMGKLIEDLLKMSRVARAEMHRERVDLSALARAAAQELQEAGPDRRVAFVIEEGVVVDGDAHLLQIALENLLGNAWKFTAKHPQASIAFGMARQDGEQVYFVRDDGAGFDMAYADKLFDPFQRLHSDAEFAGTGIGLATVQRIVRRHGGRIWAEGAVEQGATIYFTLQATSSSAPAQSEAVLPQE